MLKKLTILFAVALAALALANHILVIGSNGRGTAVTRDGRVGNFAYEVAKRTSEGQRPEYAGRLRFEQLLNDHGARVLIEMGTPHEVAVVPATHVCEFVGRGTLVTLIKGQRVSWQGRVSVRVQDRRQPEGSGQSEPDTFRIRFADEQEHTFSFEGHVREGDLVVFSRREH